jgi:hypothetical protein
MKTLQKFENCGFYHPAFFNLHVNTESDLTDLKTLNKRDKSTFFHEYIHFLQDLFTVYGLHNITDLVKRLHVINMHYLKIEKIEVPICINDKDLERIKRLGTAFQGTTEFKEIDDVLSLNLVPNDEMHGARNYEFVDIECIRFTPCEVDSFYLGGYHVQESLAYYIESLCFGDYNPPVFPYLTVDLIIERFFKDLKLSRYHRIVMCEESLNSSHPARTLIYILSHLQEKRLEFDTPEELQAYCKKYFFLSDETDNKFKFEDYIIDALDTFEKNLKGD